MSSPDLSAILAHILKDYALRPGGFHGVGHWGRVWENGLRLAEQTGADEDVVRLFALFHDSKRLNDGIDPGHGYRAAESVRLVRGIVFDLSDKAHQQLVVACAGHTDQHTHEDVTVQTCWDADRLDLGRVGIVPRPDKLCTAAAKDPAMIKWADGRAAFGVVPEFIQEWL